MKPEIKAYRTSALLALAISFLIHMFQLLVIVFGKNTVGYANLMEQTPEASAGILLLYSFLSNFIFLFLLSFVVFKVLLSRLKLKILIIFVAIQGVTLLYFCFDTAIYLKLFFNGVVPEMNSLRGRLAGYVFLSLLVTLLAYIHYINRRQEQTAIENKALLAENVKSRYEALKNQIDPHFLFNTFSSLTSMIEIDPAKAQEYALKMSSVFRYTLQNHDTVTLENELRFTADYCLLMQIRYGNNLIFEFDIEPKYCQWFVAPLSIQTLVENAIKHNVISNSNPLTVRIATAGDDTLHVSNKLQSKKVSAAGEGIGLANLAERYILKWQKHIAVTNVDDTFSVAIPLVAPDKK